MRNIGKNLWILTEERPRKVVLQSIFEYFVKDQQCGFFIDTLHIIPILNENKCFKNGVRHIQFRRFSNLLSRR